MLAFCSRSVRSCIALIDCCTVSFTDATFHPDVDADVGDKVTLNCTSPRDNATSVTWRYRSSISNASSVLFTVENGIVSQFDTSGRLSLNRTVRNVFNLVIYETQQSDSGTYSCAVDVDYEKQHVTILHVTGNHSACLRLRDYLMICLRSEMYCLCLLFQAALHQPDLQ